MKHNIFVVPFRRYLLLFLSIAGTTVVGGIAHAQKNLPLSTQYIFPLNGASSLPRATTIIIRSGPILNAKTVNAALLSVTGSFSGKHSGVLKLSDDKKTLVFTPYLLFTYSERVTVKLASGIRTSSNVLVDPVSFYFTIQSAPKKGATGLLSIEPVDNNSDLPHCLSLHSLPPLRDEIFIPTIINNPTPGYIILSPYWSGPPTSPDTSFLSIIDDSGREFWEKPTLHQYIDFKLSPDGRYSYFDEVTSKFYVMDSTFHLEDSVIAAGGYRTNRHDVEMLPHGHFLLMAYDTAKNVDLRKYFYGGDSEASIVGTVVMELDSLKQPVWIWRSLDPGGLTLPEMIDFPDGLQGHTIDQNHANSIYKDTDGNIILSLRNLDEIVKISYLGDSILWRLGGKKNQFSLIGDSMWFSHQHHVRRIANGDITLFDNGVDRKYHTPPGGNYSRACEYKLDEQAKKVQLIWQFDEGKSDTSSAMGSVERLSNGNTFISWGANNSNSTFGPAMTEVKPDGSIAFEMYLTPPFLSYRAFRLPMNAPGIAEGVSQPPSGIPSVVSLSVPYPNPSSGFSSFTLDLPSSMNVDLFVYDALGHEVAKIASGLFTGGTHTLTFDSKDLANGVYHCVLRTNYGTVTRSIVVAR